MINTGVCLGDAATLAVLFDVHLIGLLLEVGHHGQVAQGHLVDGVVRRDGFTVQAPGCKLIAFLGLGYQLDGGAVGYFVSGYSADYFSRIFRIYGSNELHLAVYEHRPASRLSGLSCKALTVGDARGLNGKRVVTVAGTGIQLGQVENEGLVVLGRNLHELAVLLLTLHVDLDILTGEGSRVDVLVEHHLQRIHRLGSHFILGRSTFDGCYFEHQRRGSLEGEDVAFGILAFKLVGEMDSVLIERILSVAQRAVGLPEVAEANLLSVAGAGYALERGYAIGRIAQIAIVPTFLRWGNGQGVFRIGCLRDA